MKIKYDTHSDQVAAEMERGIRSGIFSSGIASFRASGSWRM